MNKTTIYILILAVITVGIISVVSLRDSDQNVGGNPINPRPSLGNNVTVTATTTAKLILSGGGNRQFLSISNVGAYDAWVSATTTGLAANYGLWIDASTTQIFSGDSLYTGNIYGIGTGTTTLSILEI